MKVKKRSPTKISCGSSFMSTKIFESSPTADKAGAWHVARASADGRADSNHSTRATMFLTVVLVLCALEMMFSPSHRSADDERSSMTRPNTPLGALLLLSHLLSPTRASCGFVHATCRLEQKRQGRCSSIDRSSAAFHRDESLQSFSSRCTLEKVSSKHDNVGNSFLRCSLNISIDRRTMMTSVPAAIVLVAGAPPSHAVVDPSTSVLDLVTGQADMPQLENGVLESRVLENVMSPPPYKMEGPDIYYPEYVKLSILSYTILRSASISWNVELLLSYFRWLGGSWKVTSVTTDVQAPCGTMLFGGNATFANARKEIGTSLDYESRFISDGNGHTVADREFNVKSIAKVAMGANSVVDISLSTPNKFSCLLSPTGSPSLLTVDLIVLNRRQEDIDDENFHCSEVVREIVSPVGQSGVPSRPQSPLLKEIETVSLYRLVGPSEVRCLQRSATFLLPSQQDPMAMKMWEMSRGRPTDVRFYDVTYTKR